MDGGRIIYFLDTGKLKALKFPTLRFEPDPQGKFILNIMFGQSKYYIDSLSENVKRGLREKVRRGEFPCMAPIGYLNDYRSKTIIVDQERAPLVREAFERYATGDATLDSLRHFLKTRGVHSANGKMVGRSFVSRLLSNPIYYGHFLYDGDIHEGKHEPVISKRLFDEVESIINQRWRNSPSEKKNAPKAFLELFRCAECGSAITGEIQKGHTYYHCTKKNKAQRCAQPYIREEALDAEIIALLKPFSLRADWADEMLLRVKKDKKQSAQSAALVIAEKRAEIEKINLRLQKLLDSFLDGVIERKDYTAEKTKLMSRKKSLEDQIGAFSTSQETWLEPFQKWILAAKDAGNITVSGSLQEKRVLALKIFGSNLVLDCKKARGYCLKPWSHLLENSSSGGMVHPEGLEPPTI